MYDYLTDNFKNPMVLFINCRLTDTSLTAGLGFVSMGISLNRPLDLLDKRGVKVCQIELPRAGYLLPRDIALPLNEEKFKVLEIYG
jgi:hypothetical protein